MFCIKQNKMLFLLVGKQALLLELILFCFIFVGTAGVKVIGHDATVIYGENATLLCQLTETEDQPTQIKWKKKTNENHEEKLFFVIRPDGKTEHVNGLGDRVQFVGNFAEKNGSIQLLRIRLVDDGIYTCTFNLFPSGPFETYINITVFARPVVYVKVEEPVADNSETMLASCFASNGRPAATVMWRLGDLKKYLRTETNHTVNPNGTVTVVSYLLGAPFKHLNKKNVQCVVNHTALRDEFVLNYTINIHYPPESVVIIPDNPKNAKEFLCKVDSNPEPTNYTWTRVNKTDPRYKGKKFPVPKLTSDLNGLYICHVSNQYGSSLGSLYVNVKSDSSTTCWILFACSFLFNAVFVAVFIWKHKQTRCNQSPDEPESRCRSDDDAQAGEELQSRSRDE